jgi:hypothetical protein
MRSTGAASKGIQAAPARDRDLGDEQVDAARHPQADHVAGTDAGERARAPAGPPRPDLGIAQAAVRSMRAAWSGRRDRGRENLGQHLVADQIGRFSPASMAKGLAPAGQTPPAASSYRSSRPAALKGPSLDTAAVLPSACGALSRTS